MADKRAKSFIETIESMRLVDTNHVEQIVADQQLLQQRKYDLKNAFLESERNNLILEYLCKDPSTWPTRAEKDASLKQSRREKTEVKKRYESVKENISLRIQAVTAEYKKLEDITKQLKDKLKTFENKKESFMSKWSMDPITAKAAVSKCKEAIEKLKTELSRQNELKNQLEVSIEGLKQQQKQQHRGYKAPNVEEKVIQRAQNILAFLESMTGVKVQEASSNKLTVAFKETCSSPANVNSSMTTLQLSLTMYFSSSRLKDVQINVDHFNIKDIIDVAISKDDVPYLIRSVQERWSQHYPMLSEIETLNQHHAIDWIQNQSRLRVLVGNCGKVMFTLAIPEDYPNSRDITLVDTYGADNVDLDKLPGDGASLLDWVRHLEDMYGEKS